MLRVSGGESATNESEWQPETADRIYTASPAAYPDAQAHWKL